MARTKKLWGVARMSSRKLTFNQAIQEATYQLMSEHEEVVIVGEGVTDPGRIFNTTDNLLEDFGLHRVIESPIAENGIAGFALGMALNGLRPIIIHQRCDFTLCSFDQIINNIAKWESMFGNQQKIPIVIRMIAGQGWGQAQQHSQNLQSIFAHFPGLTVITPSTPKSAKGLLIASVNSNKPVIFIEHRWCQGIIGSVPEEMYELPLDDACKLKDGQDLTIISNSYWSLEACKIADFYSKANINIEVIDLRSLTSIDIKTIETSLEKTNKGLIIDGDWKHGGIASEIITQIVERFRNKKMPNVARLTFPHDYSPSSPFLANEFYINAGKISKAINKMLDINPKLDEFDEYFRLRILDKPDSTLKENYFGNF